MRRSLLMYSIRKRIEQVKLAIVWRLPKWVVYWCTIRSGAYATTGKHDNQNVGELTLLDTLKRWEDS